MNKAARWNAVLFFGNIETSGYSYPEFGVEKQIKPSLYN